MGSFIGFFTFVTPFLIHWITKKYVTRLEYDHEKDLYSATTLSFFLREKKVGLLQLGGLCKDMKCLFMPDLFFLFSSKMFDVSFVYYVAS